MRPRDLAGKTRRRLAVERLTELVAVDKKITTLTKELKAMVLARGSTLMDLPGVGPVVAARVLADVADVARFADRTRFASSTGTAPLDASSGEQIRHRLSRAGNRRMEVGPRFRRRSRRRHIGGHHRLGSLAVLVSSFFGQLFRARTRKAAPSMTRAAVPSPGSPISPTAPATRNATAATKYIPAPERQALIEASPWDGAARPTLSARGEGPINGGNVCRESGGFLTRAAAAVFARTPQIARVECGPGSKSLRAMAVRSRARPAA